MKLNLCIHVHDISLYLNYVFYCLCLCAFVAVATKFPLTYKGKSGNWHLFMSFCRYFDKVLQKCSWSSPLLTIWILSKPLILIGCHGNQKAKLYEKIFKNLLRSHKGDEAETLCRNVHNIGLYVNCVFNYCCLCEILLLWQLKLSIDLKWEKWKLAIISVLLQVFWQKFYRNVPWVVLYQPYAFCPNHWFCLVAMKTERLNKKIYTKLKLNRNIHNIGLYLNNVFYYHCSLLF